MTGCECTILGPECEEGREIFWTVVYAHDVAVGRIPPPVETLTREEAWDEYRAWYDWYLAHLGLITWEEWRARHGRG